MNRRTSHRQQGQGRRLWRIRLKWTTSEEAAKTANTAQAVDVVYPTTADNFVLVEQIDVFMEDAEFLLKLKYNVELNVDRMGTDHEFAPNAIGRGG